MAGGGQDAAGQGVAVSKDRGRPPGTGQQLEGTGTGGAEGVLDQADLGGTGQAVPEAVEPPLGLGLVVLGLCVAKVAEAFVTSAREPPGFAVIPSNVPDLVLSGSTVPEARPSAGSRQSFP
jgi:hypothetical protein